MDQILAEWLAIQLESDAASVGARQASIAMANEAIQQEQNRRVQEWEDCNAQNLLMEQELRAASFRQALQAEEAERHQYLEENQQVLALEAKERQDAIQLAAASQEQERIRRISTSLAEKKRLQQLAVKTLITPTPVARKLTTKEKRALENAACKELCLTLNLPPPAVGRGGKGSSQKTDILSMATNMLKALRAEQESLFSEQRALQALPTWSTNEVPMAMSVCTNDMSLCLKRRRTPVEQETMSSPPSKVACVAPFSTSVNVNAFDLFFEEDAAVKKPSLDLFDSSGHINAMDLTLDTPDKYNALPPMPFTSDLAFASSPTLDNWNNLGWAF
jgi:hypothetical protein